jgi:P-type Cu+ transporter
VLTARDNTETPPAASCYHCGDRVRDAGVQSDGKVFCCAGCKVVYELLRDHSLYEYYTIDRSPGRSSSLASDTRFAYLDDLSVLRSLKDFSDGETGTILFQIPQMHCSSCIWLLERLSTIDPGILHSRVEFLRKQLRVRFNERDTSVRKIVELLASLGYEPQINLASLDRRKERPSSRSLYYKIGIAGFCFGNIMLLSFPEYLAASPVDHQLAAVFNIVSLVLSLPVLFYSASDYFRSALTGLRRAVVTIDLPLALGILILFLRSLYEILALGQAGYLDSMSGLVFLLLVGKVFQDFSYDRLNFDRDYRSYFPLAVTLLRNGCEETVPVSTIRAGDRILVRNNEIVPADGVLLKEAGSIDYSFVTGESRSIDVQPGTVVFAGGRQVGTAAELELIRDVSRSYLTQLWNDFPDVRSAPHPVRSVSTIAGKYFTAGVVLLSAVAAALWFPSDPARAWNAITAILIVACPCAIALSTPFAFGTTARILGQNGLFLRNPDVVESLARTDSLVFDKTGTLTQAGDSTVEFVGSPLSVQERARVTALARNSHHPLSRILASSAGAGTLPEVAEFTEDPGRGIRGTVGGVPVSLGAREFVSPGTSGLLQGSDPGGTAVYLAMNGRERGYFLFHNRYRDGIDSVVAECGRTHELHLVSGDEPAERRRLERRFGKNISLHFRQSPADKLAFVRTLQAKGRHVLMLGDGLNDAGALRQSDAGIALTEDVAAFSPACHGILEARAFPGLPGFLWLARNTVRVVLANFAISLVYNGIGLFFAFRGDLSPLIAAILMPLSSITAVAFTTMTIRALARRRRML